MDKMNVMVLVMGIGTAKAMVTYRTEQCRVWLGEGAELGYRRVIKGQRDNG